MLTILFYFRWR